MTNLNMGLACPLMMTPGVGLNLECLAAITDGGMEEEEDRGTGVCRHCHISLDESLV